MYRANRARRYAASMLVGASALIVALSGCASTLEPAAPDDDKKVANTSGEKATSQASAQGSNPYEAGAVRSWSTKLSDAPSFIGYAADKKLLIIATDGIAHITQPHVDAYAVVGGDEPKLLHKWSASLQHTQMITALAVGSQSVSVNTANATGAKDLISLSIETGDILSQWSRDNGLDADVPELVGAYSEGMGVLKASSARLTAALLDTAGESVQSREHVYDHAALSDRVISKNLVDTAIAVDGEAEDELSSASEAVSAGSKEAQDLQSTVYFTFPALAIIEGNECWAVSDGYVCVSIEEADMLVPDPDEAGDKAGDDAGDGASNAASKGSSGSEAGSGDAHTRASESDSSENNGEEDHDEDSEEALIRVREYDVHGHRVRETSVDKQSVAANLSVASMDTSTDARTLSTALAAGYKGEAQSSRMAAIFYDGAWIERSAWKVPQGFQVDDAQALADQPPLCRFPSGAIVNIRTGKEVTSEGAIGYVGVGDASSMLFEYADGVLYYLAPGQAQ